MKKMPFLLCKTKLELHQSLWGAVPQVVKKKSKLKSQSIRTMFFFYQKNFHFCFSLEPFRLQVSWNSISCFIKSYTYRVKTQPQTIIPPAPRLLNKDSRYYTYAAAVSLVAACWFSWDRQCCRGAGMWQHQAPGMLWAKSSLCSWEVKPLMPGTCPLPPPGMQGANKGHHPRNWDKPRCLSSSATRHFPKKGGSKDVIALCPPW